MHHSTVVIVQSLSHVQLFATQCTATQQASLSFTNSWNLLKLHIHWVSDAIWPSHLLLLRSPPAFNTFKHQGLSHWVGSLHLGTKYWSFSFSISPSNEYSVLISFKIDWFNLLAIEGTLHHNSKASILCRSAFFMVRLSHPYMTTGKTMALTRRTFVGKVMSLLFNDLSLKSF